MLKVQLRIFHSFQGVYQISCSLTISHKCLNIRSQTQKQHTAIDLHYHTQCEPHSITHSHVLMSYARVYLSMTLSVSSFI